MRTILPLILLAALIVSIWPTGPLDFGSRSPWDGLVILIDGVERFIDEDGDSEDGDSEDGDSEDGDAANSARLDPQSRLLLIASLPAVDDLGRDCSLIVGTAFADHSDPLALLLQGETDAIRLQKIKMVAPPVEMYLAIEGIISGFAVPGDLDVDRFPGGLLHGHQVTPAAGSRQGPPPTSILLADSRGSIAFKAHCDEQKQQAIEKISETCGSEPRTPIQVAWSRSSTVGSPSRNHRTLRQTRWLPVRDADTLAS